MKKPSLKIIKIFLICLLGTSLIFIKGFYFKKYSRGHDKIPYYSQRDIRWSKELYGKKGTIKKSGCGPTSLAMVISGLTGREDINPKVIADWSSKHGYRAEGKGSYWSLMTNGGQVFGLKVEQVSRKNKNKILKELKNEKIIIVCIDKGKIAKGGHFIVLRGITRDDRILMYDPNSVLNSNIAWNPDTIFNESSKNGGEKGSPFWVFSKK